VPLSPSRTIVQTLRYLKLQAELSQGGLREALAPIVQQGLPLPPPRLRKRVAGISDADAFIRAGIGMKKRLVHALRITGNELSSFQDILDFRCGSGRLLRHFKQESSDASITGCDIDEPAIRWCQRNLDFAKTFVNRHEPPLPFADASFDLIISISIVTHLDENMQHAWLAELSRVAKPGATLLLTVQQHRLGPLSPRDRKYFHEHGFVYFKEHSADRFVLGLPDFYQAARHSETYIEREWSRYFSVERFVKGPKLQQDIVVCRKPS
jgi:ubiquinone/menaquinone biosynthesis C-methylase UbiE